MTPPSTASLPRPFWFVGNFTKGITLSAVGPPSFPHKFVLHRRRRSPNPERRVLLFGAAIFRPLDVVTFRDDLEIDVIEHSDLHIDRSDRQRLQRLGVRAVIRVAEKIHLDLVMAGVDRVGAFRLVRPIRRHLAQQCVRSRAKQIVATLVRTLTRERVGHLKHAGERGRAEQSHRPDRLLRSCDPDHHFFTFKRRTGTST